MKYCGSHYIIYTILIILSLSSCKTINSSHESDYLLFDCKQRRLNVVARVNSSNFITSYTIIVDAKVSSVQEFLNLEFINENLICYKAIKDKMLENIDIVTMKEKNGKMIFTLKL